MSDPVVVIEEAQRTQIGEAMKLAWAQPISLEKLEELYELTLEKGYTRDCALHVRQQCPGIVDVFIEDWMVSFSFENQPGGLSRHITVAHRSGSFPSQVAVQTLATEFGFGDLEDENVFVYGEQCGSVFGVSVIEKIVPAKNLN